MTTPTPKTDAAAFYAGDVGDEVVMASVCREIENDLAISQIRAEDWRKTAAYRERDLAAAKERIRELEDWSRQMVEKAASGGALDGYRELGAKLAKAEERAEEYRKDAERLDSVASEYFKIEPFEMPTGAGDADVGWRITKFYMAKPCERVAAEVFLDDPRAAIDAAMKEKP